MTLLKTIAIAIRKIDYSETSQVVTFFTKDYGKITAIAKGSKRKKTNFDGPIDIFYFMKISFINKLFTELDILTETVLENSFQNVRSNLNKTHTALYFCELIDKLTVIKDPNLFLFESFLKSLETLSKSKNPSLNLEIVKFEGEIVRLIGHKPRFDKCVICGLHHNRFERVYFCSAKGGIICHICTKQMSVDGIQFSFIPNETFNIMSVMLDSEAIYHYNLKYVDEQLYTVHNILSEFFSYLIQKNFRMSRYVALLFR